MDRDKQCVDEEYGKLVEKLPMFKEQKTAEQINTPSADLEQSIVELVDYLYGSRNVQDEESFKEIIKDFISANHLVQKANIIKQMILWFNGEISKEKLAENLGMNFYELDAILSKDSVE